MVKENTSDEKEPPSGAVRNWRLAKIGGAMTCLSFIVYGMGIYFATKFSSKIVPFGKFSNYLMVVGMALVAWNVYVNYFRKQ